MQRESIAAVRTEKLGTHSHTHTHTHTHRTTAIPSLLACGDEGNDNLSTQAQKPFGKKGKDRIAKKGTETRLV